MAKGKKLHISTGEKIAVGDTGRESCREEWYVHTFIDIVDSCPPNLLSTISSASLMLRIQDLVILALLARCER